MKTELSAVEFQKEATVGISGVTSRDEALIANTTKALIRDLTQETEAHLTDHSGAQLVGGMVVSIRREVIREPRIYFNADASIRRDSGLVRICVTAMAKDG